MFLAGIVLVGLSSCNSNDDWGGQAIDIPGITIDGDIDCCSAEEALQVYKFLQTVKIVPELSTEIDGKYNVFAYTTTGSFHNGYNEIFFVATKKATGNYIKNFDITGLTPLMHMVKMDMYHSTPVGPDAASFNDGYLAVKRTWVSFVMNTSEAGSWTLSYDALVLGSKGGIEKKDVVVNALPDGQTWLKSFKVDDATYYLSLVNPLDFKTGTNTITAYVSKKSAKATVPYALASETFTIDIEDTVTEGGEIDDTFRMSHTYGERVMDYLMANINSPVLRKIQNLEKITGDDISELQRILWEELGSREEYDAFVGHRECGNHVAVFIRSMIGIDRKVAIEKFSSFLDETTTLTAEQEEYAGVFDYARITEKSGVITDFWTDNLLDLILRKDNMNKAYKKVKSNGGAGGIDGMQVDELLPYLKEHSNELIQKIKDGKYKPNPVRRVEIPKETKG